MSTFFAVAYLIAEYMRPQSMYETLASVPFAQIAIFGLALSFVFEKRDRLNANPLNLLLVLYFAWYVVSYAFAYDHDIAWQSTVDFSKWIVLYFLLTNTINDRRRYYIFVFVLLLLYFKMAQYAVRIWVGAGFYSDPRGLNAGGGMATSFFQNPNDFGAALCSAFGLAYYMIWHDLKRIGPFRLQWWHAANAVLFVLSIIASSSRGSLLALGVVFAGIWAKSARKSWALIAIILCATAVVAAIPDDNWKRLQNIGTERDNSSQSRLELWAAAVQMMKDHPIVGVGPDNFVTYNVQRYFSERSQVQHNIFLQAGSELGLPGLALLLGMIAVFYMNQRKIRIRLREAGLEKSQLYGLSHALDICMLGFVANGMSITILYYPFFWTLLIMSSSLAATVEAETLTEEKAREMPRKEPLGLQQG